MKQTLPNISFFSKWSGVLLSIFILVLGCEDESGERIQTDTDLMSITVDEPVNRDYAEIRRGGVLRMITSYSSGSYFLHRGIQVGFEYELVREFAKKNNLALEVIIPAQDENPYDLLNSGAGDLIAANYTITEERKEWVNFTRPYNLVNQLVVVSAQLGFEPESVSDLNGIPITIRRNSSYYHTLKELQDQGYDLQMNLVPEDMDTETLLFKVADGTYAATIADDNIYSAAGNYMTGLIRGPVISERDEIAWAIRKNGPDLEAKMNQFLYQHFRYDEEGVPKRSAFLNVLRKKYFKRSAQIADYFRPEMKDEIFGNISPYDSLMKAVGGEFGLDWVMLTAIAAQESKFDPYSESWAGAVGVMQVLPRFSQVSRDSLFIPEVNIREGARILREHLEHYAYLDSTEQWQFALATYNAGMGHVADARRLAIDRNKNPNEWIHISDALLRLMQKRYYQNARYGFARGIETVRYVNEITNRYNTYQAILLANQNDERRSVNVFGIKTFN